MSGPWEKYQSAAAPSGPWQKYAQASNGDAQPQQPEEEPGLRPGGLSATSLKGGIPAILDALGGSSDTTAKNLANGMSLGNISQYSPGFRRDLLYQNKEFPNSANLGKIGAVAGIGSAAGSLAPLRVAGDLTATMSAPSLAASGGINITPAIASAAQGFLEAPGNIEGTRDDLYKRLSSVPAAAAMGVGAQALGGMAGSGGDRLMQRAVGRNRYTPGVGQELADQGVWGTRGMMKNQVASAKSNVYDQMNDLVSQQNNFNALRNSNDIANNVRGLGDRFNFGNTTSILDQPRINEIENAAKDIELRGWEDPKTMLGRRAAAGGRVPPAGWDKSDPTQALRGAISKAEQQGYSTALKDAVPGLSPLDNTYSALAKAGSALNREAPMGALPKYGIPGAGAGIGFMAGGPIGSGIGSAAGYLSTTPIGLSSLGRSGIAAGRYSPAMSANAIDALIRKSMKDDKK